MDPRVAYYPHDYCNRDDDDASTITTDTGQTIGSSVTAYRYENGRRYHAYREGQYWGPNDEKQKSHEEIVHHIWLMTLDDELFLAPVREPRYVLDVGTGIGLWAENFADRYPSAEVLGTDLSPTQIAFPAPNLHFETDDAMSEWTYPENHFDFIHVRGLFGSIDDWPRFHKQCFRHLKPGGYVEHAEISTIPWIENDEVPPDDIFRRWGELTSVVEESTGMHFFVVDMVKDSIKAVGFKDIKEHRFKWPIGPWSSDPKARDIGEWNVRSWQEGMEGWLMAMCTRRLGWTYERVQAFIKETMKELERQLNRTSTTRAYQEISVVYARKPKHPN
ncbi:MAG: hypothetical protein M1834_005952 [Cirrosporium novae-zelandiae]|nr:MAG: hypothetical protein M1834_005952 [Cirrosporium novae-zelandiae]